MRRIIPYFPLILVLFHVIGAILFLTEPSFAKWSYGNILLCAILVFLSETQKLRAFGVLTVIFICGFLIEYIGIHTGYLFGDYSYGSSLGKKFLDTPIIIGLNWYAIVVASSSLVSRLKISVLIKATLAAAAATMMDYLIEPVAIKYDMWHWTTPSIPLFNYACWFAFALLFAYIYLKGSPATNRTGQWLYLIWGGFFLVLNFV